MSGSGEVSWYGDALQGQRTANGEKFDMYAMTAAHKTLPFNTMLRVTNPSNGASVDVRINDRGPFHGDRVIDLSKGAFQRVENLDRGVFHGKFKQI
jgi:rare lipoprotein A